MTPQLTTEEQNRLGNELEQLLATYGLTGFALFSVKNRQLILLDRNTKGTVLRHVIDATIKKIKKSF
ncbi:hypothetical protein [Runella sp.]|uniref:hypothetical protein n=1 Tax=Runella sp. TaxID=1960881 RepID=UPI003D0B89B1